ncbi:hypothetical protein [Maribacter luteus]|uniref:hypothetical protein n=1 Tax=Maribacter luteus TaxID=2594478 RepID=UPI00248FEB25|nr:hypothetical protein [Maribacter luteus]|tara:strand:+ start:678 stop:1541 length:864 start_codon:yes stop_codon:yes gene_type:complete
MAILVLSSLPYFNDVITTQEGVREWVPNLGIKELLTDTNNRVLGFSSYRMLIYTLSIFIFSEIGWATWLYVTRRRPYHLALYVPFLFGLYQIFLILLDLRRTWANDWDVKLFLILGLSCLFAGIYLSGKKRFTLRIASRWIMIICITVLPFVHDLFTDRTGNVKSWVPVLGFENLLTDNEGMVGGFVNYRLFVYFLMIHVYAHLGWLGAFIYYEHTIRKVRPFLLVPVIISFYSVIVILLDWRETGFNTPDFKFYLTLFLAMLLAINYFFNDKPKNSQTITININEK